MLYTARKYICGRCYNGTIMSTLFVTQYYHAHFHGGGLVVVESTCSTPRNPLYTTKELFQSRFINEYYPFARWRYFTTTSRILFVFSLHVFIFNLVISARSKALICRRKRNPEDSGRSSKMASLCQWPFSSFLIASSLLNSTATKNRVWPSQEIGKFCNYQNFKDAYSFLSGDKILFSFYFDSCPSLGHLISRTLSISVIGYTKNSRV